MATRGKKEKEYPPMPANWMYKRGDAAAALAKLLADPSMATLIKNLAKNL